MAQGISEKVFTALLAQADAEGDLDWLVAVASTIVRAHQHQPGPGKKGAVGEPAHVPSSGPAVDCPVMPTVWAST